MGRWTGGMVDWDGVRAFVKIMYRSSIYKDSKRKESEKFIRGPRTPKATVSLGCESLYFLPRNVDPSEALTTAARRFYFTEPTVPLHLYIRSH
jgi:hypothetical protein